MPFPSRPFPKKPLVSKGASQKIPQKEATPEGKSVGRGGFFLLRPWVLGGMLLGVTGISFLAIWVDWTKWTLSRWERQLPNLSPEEATLLLRQMASWIPTGIPILIQGLCDSRPEVAEAAQKELFNLQQQWENQGWHQVSESLSLLATTLERRKEDLPSHSRHTARQLAEWILSWYPPEGSPERVEMVRSCERVLAYLDQTAASSGSVALSASPMVSGRPLGSLAPGTELVDPGQGFHLAGGGLPVEGLSSDLSVGADGVSADSLVIAQAAEAEARKFPSSQPTGGLRILGPIQADAFPKMAGSIPNPTDQNRSEGKVPRMNQPVRTPNAPGEPGAELSSGSSRPTDGMRLPKGRPSDHPEISGGRENRTGISGEGIPPDAAWDKGEDLKEKSVGALLELLAAASGKAQRPFQAELARRGFGQVTRQLAQQLCDPNPQVRLDLVRRLPAMAGVEATAWLFWLCEDPDAQVRATAKGLLATTNDPAVLQQLERMLSSSPEDPLRRQTERRRTLQPPRR